MVAPASRSPPGRKAWSFAPSVRPAPPPDVVPEKSSEPRYVDGSNEAYAAPDAAAPPKRWRFEGVLPKPRVLPRLEPREVDRSAPPVANVAGGMSDGTTVQMLAVGPQDSYLHLNPEVTRFASRHERHTNFAVECFEERFSREDFRFGEVNTCVLGKHGDFLGDVTLRIVLPNLGVPGAWVDTIGYVLLSRVRLRVGDVVVHDQERLWYDLDDKLFCTEGRARGLARMIGRRSASGVLSTSSQHEILVPLKFFFCERNRGTRQFFPTAVDANIVMDVFVERLDACVTDVTGLLPTTASARATVLVDNLFVDLAEKPAYGKQEVMIDVVQDVDALSYQVTNAGNFPVTTVSVDMRSLNLPVRYLVVVAYHESWSEPFAYLDAIDAMTFYVHSNEQFSPRGGGYFDLVQTYDRTTRSETSNVGVLSFALDAHAWQPCGSLDFSALTAPALKVQLKPTAVPLKVKVFAVMINWLECEGGKCALRFAG